MLARPGTVIPATGEALKIPAKTVVKARIAKQLKDGGGAEPGRKAGGKGRIAVVYAEGEIVDGDHHMIDARGHGVDRRVDVGRSPAAVIAQGRLLGGRIGSA